jgi:CRISPR-associated protein Cmr4
MTTTALLGLLAQTSLHAGANTQSGIIDLPIQREGHNGYPCVFGSAMKGALRTRAEDFPQSTEITAVYGAAHGADENSASAGAVIVTDARLLLFPVRSLTSQFKWVTCPDVLRRFKEDAKRLGLTADFDLTDDLKKVGENQAFMDGKENKEVSLFLEEYRFIAQQTDLGKIIEALAKLMQRDDAQQALQKQLVIVNNDSFTHLVNHATPVNAHIAIDSDTKIVRNGALWYEETLPPETLLYVGLSANKERKKENPLSAEAVLNRVLDLFPEDKPYLQIGGNETVGMGWCIVKICSADLPGFKNLEGLNASKGA